MPMGGFGPRVQAIAALCTAAAHWSKRTTQRALEDLFGVQMGLEDDRQPGAGDRAGGDRAGGGGPGHVEQHSAAYLEETGWRAGQQRAWLWTAVTAYVTVL